MKNHFTFCLFALFLFVFSCTPEVAEQKIYHSTDLHHELWKEDTTARGQVFMLREDTVTTIVCEGGTKIIIPANVFEPEEGPNHQITGDVQLEVVEVKQQAEMLRHHLSTQEEGGKLLESAGMLYLTAYAEGKKLRLREGKEILLGFPKRKDFKEAALFSGVWAEGGALQWKKEKGEFKLEEALLATYFPQGLQAPFRIITEDEKLLKNRLSSDTAARNNSRIPVVLMEDENVSDQFDLLKDYNEFDFFRSSSLEWINCDRFVEEKPADLRLEVSGYPANTLYYFIFEDLNSVVTGYPGAGGSTGTTTVFEGLPVGRKGELVLIYYERGRYFLAHQSLTIEENLKLRLEPVKMEKKAIRDFLSKFSKPVALTASR